MLRSIDSRTADGSIRTIIEETESVYVRKFQRLINGTIASGVFARPSTTKSAAGRAWFASGFIGLYLCYSHPTSQVSGAYRLAYRSRFVRAVRSCFAREGCGFLSTFLFAPPELHKTGTIRKHWNRATEYAKTGYVPEAVSEIRALVCGLKNCKFLVPRGARQWLLTKSATGEVMLGHSELLGFVS